MTQQDALTVSAGADHLELHPRLTGANVEDFEPAFFDRLLDARTDILAEQVLAAGEPDLARVAHVLPGVVGYTFVGHPGVDERAIIEPDGSIKGVLGPLAEMPREELVRRARWGILDPRLPLPMLRIDLSEGRTLEQIALAVIGAEGELRVLVRRRELSGDDERVEDLAPGSEQPPAPGEFDAAIIDAWHWACDWRARTSGLSGGDAELSDLALASLWLGDLTMRGRHPRYGIGTYDRFKDHGFPPTVLHLGLCLLEWGRLARAAGIIDCYLDAFVSEEGTFVYYGPAVAEYGQLLALAARYVELTGDMCWWMRRQSVLRRIWRRLLGLRRESVADESAPEHARGLIAGLPEADYHGSDEQWREYYYAGDAWAVRGLGDMARILRLAGQRAEAEVLQAEVDEYRRDLLASVEAASVEVGGAVYVPPGPTQRSPIERMTQDRHASYCNYRYFAEMVSAGVLEPETVRRVIAWRRAHGGELLAMTRFEDHLDDWPVLNWARAMLEVGDVERYQLLLYAHLAHHQCVGWLSAPEQVSIRPDDSGARYVWAGQVVPCQVTVPLMLRWSLLYELRDEETLLVAPAALHRWTEGEGLSARGLLTRWGPVDLSLRSEGATLTVSLSLPGAMPAGVRLRIPRPPGATVTLSSVTGATEHHWDAEAGVVTFRGGPMVRVVAQVSAAAR